MVNHRAGYMLLLVLSAVILLLLMLDDPAIRLERMRAYEATLQAQRPLRLFAQIPNPEHVDGIEVLDVTTGKGLLLMREPGGVWYAPEIQGIQQPIAAEAINQHLVENAAAAIMLLAAEQQYEATADSLLRFGLQPAPAYRIRFRAHDASGATYEGLVDVGDTNPDNVAYYVYAQALPEADQRVFLVRKQIVDNILAILFDPVLVAPAPYESPAANEATPFAP